MGRADGADDGGDGLALSVPQADVETHWDLHGVHGGVLRVVAGA